MSHILDSLEAQLQSENYNYNRPLDPFLPGNYLVIARFSGQLLMLCAVRKMIFDFEKRLISREIGHFAGKFRKLIKILCKNFQSRHRFFIKLAPIFFNPIFPGNFMFNECRIYYSQSSILPLIVQYSSLFRKKRVDWRISG